MTVTPAIFALAVVLAAASDWELVVEGVPERICAKSAAVCETARAAIRDDKWSLGVPADARTECRPAPDCFSYESETIAGFNREPRR